MSSQSQAADVKKVSIKREGSPNSIDESTRIRQLEDETRALKEDVKTVLEKLEGQEETLREMRAAARARATLCWVALFVCVVLLTILFLWLGSVFREDTALVLHVKATPRTTPFLAVGVKTEFTVGDVLATVKGAFADAAGGVSPTDAR